MRRHLTLLACSLMALPALAGTERRASPGGNTSAWLSTGEGLAIELLQVAPDSVRAMYARKDFSKPLQEAIAAYCVFGTVIRNTTGDALSYDMGDWRYRVRGGKPQRLRTKDQWLAEWRQHGVDFAYSLLPPAQTFEAGDWGQGLMTFTLPRKAVFDFTYSWTQHGRQHHATLEGVQ